MYTATVSDPEIRKKSSQCCPIYRSNLLISTEHSIFSSTERMYRVSTETISRYASDVSAIPEVRAFLLSLQRDMAKETSVIMDGRDIGTVVLPDAEVKIFMTASAEVRARRRYKELVEKGESVVFEDVLAAIITRDTNDSTRATAPLKAADDAVILDNSEINAEETLNKVIEIIRSKTK